MEQRVPAALAGARSILDSAPLAIMAADRSGRILWTNGHLDAMFGYARGTVQGQSLEVLVPDRLRAVHAGHRAGFFGDPRVRPMGLGLDLTGRRRDGQEFPVEISLSYLGAGADLIALAFITDITQRKEAERRLQCEFAVTSVFTESAPIDEIPGRLVRAVCESLDWTVGEFWRVEGDALRRRATWHQPAWDASLLDRATPEAGIPSGTGLVGRAAAAAEALWADNLAEDLLAGRGESAARLGLRAACAVPIRTEQAVTGVIALLDRDRRAADATLLAMLTDVGRRIGQHLDLRRAERELARQRDALYQSEKLAALGQLVAGVAHEMNNPLGIMSSRIELILSDAEGQALPPQLVEDLRVLHRNTLRVARVAQALRSFARQAPGEQRPISLNRVVEETLLLAGRPMSAENIQIETALDPELPLVMGDPNALQQVLLNLLTNAREAMPGGGRIRIETGPAPERHGRLRLGVTDTGHGIAPADLPHVFEPFYTTKSAGTGLGLAVSYGIVQDHRGTIEAESSPGRGTTFALTFPALEPAAERA
jgi:two-component system, cell cycle sensor histidine kinase and response regulator CckA